MINVVKVESWRVEREEKKDGRSGGSSGGGKKELFWMGFFSSLHFYSLLPPVTQLIMAKLPLPPELWYEFSAQWFLTACYFESCPPFPSTFLLLPHDRWL
jgi:hypothetical protein